MAIPAQRGEGQGEERSCANARKPHMIAHGAIASMLESIG
jgi:hypothetical protein